MTRLALLLVVWALGGCSKKEEPPPPQPAAPAPAPLPVTGTAPVASPPESADIPTEEDFEAEAERRITSQNLEAELDKLEKEIAEQ